MDLMDILKRLGLWHWFPGKLNRVDLFAIGHNNSYEVNELESFDTLGCVNTFLNGIVHCDGNCRYTSGYQTRKLTGSLQKHYCKKFSHQTGSLDIHPLDTSTAVFLCCDHSARQDLVRRYWDCQHAIPLVVKTEQLEPPMMYIWPLTDLYYQREDFIKPVFSYEMKIISAIRFSHQDISKSNLLNIILSENMKPHSVFFHRNCTGSVKKLSDFCYGMIEAQPVLNSENEPMLFLNLRGHGFEHTTQLNFLKFASNVIIVLCGINELNLIGQFVEGSIRRYELLVIIVSDLDPYDEDESLHQKVENCSTNLSVKNYVIAMKGVSHSEFNKEISSVLKDVHSKHSIEDLKKSAEINSVDIDCHLFKNTLDKSKTFKTKIMNENESSVTSIFPLQGQEGVEWSKADLEIERLRKIRLQDRANVREYRENLASIKRDIRVRQIGKILTDKTKAVQQFLDHYFNIDDKEIFLRSLKFEMETVGKSNQKILHKRYKALMKQHKVDKTKAKHIEHELELLDVKLNSSSFSLNVIVREMSQMYETINSENSVSSSYFPEPVLLVNAAVSLLSVGFEIEIMDGRTKYVSRNWINGVLNELKRQIGNARVKVITVLGIQSTGKSTLLNIMFGSQFEVSYGCCTRGAQMHLVKVSPKTAKEYLADYFIIIDSEGLYSTAKKWQSEERRREERELATFVIGLSHVTIINIMGEHVTYLRDILPICVHAFLRMNQAGINAHCKIIYHGVDKSKSDQLLPQTVSLESELDWHTVAACKSEGEQEKRFRDIIQFDITKDIEYFPILYENDSWIEIINPAFSRAVVQLKQKLLDDRDAVRTLSDFTDHLNNLWTAIKRDNFVYEFTNTIETTARTLMDKRLCNRQWRIRRKVQNNMKSYKLMISNITNVGHLQEIMTNYRFERKQIQNDEEHISREEFSIAVPNMLLAKAMKSLQDSYVKKANETIEECQKICDSLVNRDFLYRQTEMNILTEDVLNNIDSFLDYNLNVQFSTQNDGSEIAEKLFNDWCDTLWSNDVYKQTFALEEDAMNYIYSSYLTHRLQVDELLQVEDIQQRNLSSFLKRFPDSYWLHKNVSSAEKAMAKNVAEECFTFVKHLEIELKTMKQFYHSDMFKDIILEVRNHKSLFYGVLLTKPVFEIELVMSLCGEFIERVKNICWDRNLYSERLMKNTEIYFKSRCREKLKYKSTLNEIVESFVNVIINGSAKAISEALPQTIAIHLKNKHKFMNSKQGILCFVWSKMIEQRETFLKYLSSPDIAARITFSEVFDRLIRFDMEHLTGDLATCIEECASQSLEIYTKAIKNQMLCFTISQNLSTPIEITVEILKNSLGNLLNLESTRMFEHDFVNDINVDAIITNIISSLQSQSRLNALVGKIEYSLKENLDAYKHETVSIILENLNGCQEKCPMCGEICCISNELHTEKHKALMHKPIGFTQNVTGTTKNATLTCRELMEHNDQEVLDKLKHWAISPDTSASDNSFWKYMYVLHMETNTCVSEMNLTDNIPESWRALTKQGELSKLEELIKRFSEDD